MVENSEEAGVNVDDCIENLDNGKHRLVHCNLSQMFVFYLSQLKVT